MPPTGSPFEVLRVFLKLGLTSFGGPIAHIGYFREELVVRRRWVDDAAYTDLVALCQFLPGPASSQVGFSLGPIRAGYWLLGAALYNPLWTSSIKSNGDFALALVGFVLLTVWRVPPLLVVVLGALGGLALSY